MIKIRLARGGMRNDPSYRIVAIESSNAREGKPLDTIGFWHPRTKKFKINRKKYDSWVKKGAQTTKAVTVLLR